jgi:hypothetical protein
VDLELIEESRLSFASGHSSVPAIAAGECGALCVVWSDLRGGNADLYFRRSDDQSGISVEEPIAGLNRGVTVSVPCPNPFAAKTRIDFALPQMAQASVKVFDVEGRLVDVLAQGRFEAGPHSVTWDGRTSEGAKVAAGIYFIRCKSPIGEDVSRVVVAR